MTYSVFSGVRVRGVLCKVPTHTRKIEEDLELYKNDIAFLERNKKILGLNKRRTIEEGTSLSDLCISAAEDLIKKLDIKPEKIESLITVSTSHDFHYPATSCVIQGKLKLNERCACFDISGLACSAYVYGLWVAHSLISSGAVNNCLLLAGDLTSTHSHKKNRNSNVLFGDAGSATFLEKDSTASNSFFSLGTQGKYWDKLIAPAGGYYLPIRDDIAGLELQDSQGNLWRMYDDIMKGLDVFKFTTEVGPKGLTEVLDFAQMKKDDISYFAFHQANKQIVRTVASYSKLPSSKYSWEAFEEFGNCGAAAIVTDLCFGMPKDVRWVALSSFGVGLSWSFAILDFSKTHVFHIEEFEPRSKPLSREEKIKYWINYFIKG